jgi:hypothetical protein
MLRACLALLGKLAWPATLLLIAGLVVVVCFGGTRIFYMRGYVGVMETWEHGWPLKFLSRSCNAESSRLALWEGKHLFYAWSLLVDGLVFVSLLLALVLGPRWLARRRSLEDRGWGFSLASLMVVVTLCCLLLGHLGHALASARAERPTLEFLRKQGHIANQDKYIGPLWLARICAADDLSAMSDLRGCKSLTLRGRPGENEMFALAVAIQALPNLEYLSCEGFAIRDADLQRLLPLNRSVHITSLTFEQTQITGAAFRDPLLWPQLVDVDLRLSPVDDTGFANLARIPSLIVVDVSKTKITKESIALAAKLPKLELFIAAGMGFTEEDCAELKKRGVDCFVRD